MDNADNTEYNQFLRFTINLVDSQPLELVIDKQLYPNFRWNKRVAHFPYHPAEYIFIFNTSGNIRRVEIQAEKILYIELEGSEEDFPYSPDQIR